MKSKSCFVNALSFFLAVAANGFQTGAAAAAEDANPIRTFQVKIPQNEIDDLKKRIIATRWPDKEAVNDQSQGVPLATAQALLKYWGKDYNWRKCDQLDK